MSWGRVAATTLSCAAVAGAAVVVVGMAHATQAGDTPAAAPVGLAGTSPARPRTTFAAPLATTPAASTPAPASPSATSAATARGRTAAAVDAPATSSSAARSSRPTRTAAAAHRPAAHRAPASSSAAHTVPATPHTTPRAASRQTTRKAAPSTHAAPAGRRLPLGFRTGTATRVVTVVARSHCSTTATLRAWTKVGPGRWKQWGRAVTAWIGADGVGTASETRSKTPAGSFTLTQAFGRHANPGTHLRWFRTTPADYWISSRGPKYNTHQRCAHCGYDNGVNEHLYYETPYYNYAVVIDYNTRNSPGGVRQGAGSAFFLHVSVGSPTAGCVAIPQARLVSIMRWLRPAAHPRILIGVG